MFHIAKPNFHPKLNICTPMPEIPVQIMVFVETSMYRIKKSQVFQMERWNRATLMDGAYFLEDIGISRTHRRT